MSDALDRQKRSTQEALYAYRDGLLAQTRESMDGLAVTGQVLEETAAAHEALAQRIHERLSDVNRRDLSLAAGDSYPGDASIRFVARVPGEAVLVVFDPSHLPAGGGSTGAVDHWGADHRRSSQPVATGPLGGCPGGSSAGGGWFAFAAGHLVPRGLRITSGTTGLIPGGSYLQVVVEDDDEVSPGSMGSHVVRQGGGAVPGLAQCRGPRLCGSATSV